MATLLKIMKIFGCKNSTTFIFTIVGPKYFWSNFLLQENFYDYDQPLHACKTNCLQSYVPTSDAENPCKCVFAGLLPPGLGCLVWSVMNAIM